MELYAVLTGDVIGSSRLPATLRKELQGWLKVLARDFAETHGEVVVGKLEAFRGDSWQVCLTDVSLALRAAIFMRAGLKAHPSRENVDTRVGIGVGTVEVLTKSKISESNGEAFIRSGRGLDALRGDLSLWLEWPDGPAQVEAINRMSLPLLDLAVGRFSHAESVAVYGAMRGWTQEETAEHALARKEDGKAPTRQAIANALTRVCWSSHLHPVLEASTRFLKPEGECNV